MGDDAYDVRLFSDAAAKKVFTTYLNRSMIENKVRQLHRETHSKLTHVALAASAAAPTSTTSSAR